jgi:hypothetical protein
LLKEMITSDFDGEGVNYFEKLRQPLLRLQDGEQSQRQNRRSNMS